MFAVLSAIVPIFLVAGAGYGLRKGFPLDAKTLSTLNIFLLIPVLVFESLREERIEWGVYGGYIVATILMLAAMSVVLSVVARLRGLQGEMRSAFMMTMFMNLGNFGLPVANFAFGEQGLALAVIVMVCGMFFQNAMALFFAHQNSHGAGRALLQIFRFPLLYAFILALLFQHMDWDLPEILDRAIGLTAGATIPIQLLILGIAIAETKLETTADVFIASAIRLLVGPVVGWLAATAAGLEGLAAQIFILQMSGPVAVAMAVFGVQFGVRPAYLASVVTWTFLLSLITVSVVLFILLRVY